MYVKDESANLNVMTSTLKYVVNCELFSLGRFPGHCFWPWIFQHMLIFFCKTSNMFPLSLFSLIYKNA
jgi:hypothetical protein